MISLSTPYTSFPAYKKYLFKEQPEPVSHMAHLLSDDMELYMGNNNQLRSIQRNRINFFDAKEYIPLATKILSGVTNKSTSSTSSQQAEAERRLAQERAIKEAASKKKITTIAIGVVIAIVIIIVAIKLKK